MLVRVLLAEARRALQADAEARQASALAAANSRHEAELARLRDEAATAVKRLLA